MVPLEESVVAGQQRAAELIALDDGLLDLAALDRARGR